MEKHLVRRRKSEPPGIVSGLDVILPPSTDLELPEMRYLCRHPL